MKSHLVLVDRDELLIELRQVFDVQTAKTLLHVLDKVADQVYAAGVTREDFSELKAIVADLAEAQRQSEIRLSGVETRLSGVETHLSGVETRLSGVETRLSGVETHLSDVETRLSGVETRLNRLEESVVALVEAQRRTGDQIKELVEVQKLMDKRLSRLEDKFGRIDGRTLELTYREKADAYLSRLLRRPEVVAKSELWELLEPHLSEDEISDVCLIDLVVHGKPRKRPDVGDLWLTIEVSVVVDRKDVERTYRRADLLRRVGYKVIPVVAGEEATLGAEAEARSQSVVMLQDGRSLLWDEAFAKWAV